METAISRELVLDKIQRNILSILTSLSKNRVPSLRYLNRNIWKNVSFQEDVGLIVDPGASETHLRLDYAQSVPKFAMAMKLISTMYHLVQTDTWSTKRDLYYQNIQLFGTQRAVDSLVDDIACMLNVPRWSLHVLATSKGYLAGDLEYMDENGTVVDCSVTKMGLSVPNHTQSLKWLRSTAQIVIVVEKDATFQKLLDGNIFSKIPPAILITGKGFPDINTRLMVKKLWDTFHLPTLALVDADPHGLDILFTYKYGSRSLAFQSQYLTTPNMKWLGILPEDIDRLQVPEKSLIPFTKRDESKCRDLFSRPYMDDLPVWKKQLQKLVVSGKKAEIQCLDAINAKFLCDVYLPNKLKFEGWI